jgi:PAS domain S-box-containing protein
MYSTLPAFELAVLSGLLSAIVAGVAYRQCATQSPYVRYSFVGVAVGGLLWSFGYANYLLVGPANSYAALRWMWFGVLPYVTLWFVFVIAYTGHTELLTRSTLGLLAIEPVFMLVAALTLPSHDLFISGETVGVISGYAVTVPTLGPLFAFHQTYVFMLGVASLGFLVRTLGDTDSAYHPQVAVLLVAGVVPLFGPIEQLFDMTTVAIHSTPPLLSLSSGLVLLGIARYRLFDILPTARDRVLSTMEDGVVLVDEQDRIRIANTAARRQLALPEPVIGRDATTVLPCGSQLVQLGEDGGLTDTSRHPTPSDSSTIPQTDGGHPRLEPHPSGVELVLDPDGEGTHLIVSTESVPVDTAIEGTLLVFRDVTDQRSQELEFQAVLEHTADVVAILRSNGSIKYVSPSIETELSYTQLELVGTDICELFHPDDTDAIEDEIQSVATTDETIHSQYRIKTGEENWRMVETTAQGGRSTPATDGAIITIRDVTDRHRYEQRRRVMNRVLRHDLRNDMNVVVGHAEILAESIDPGRVRHAETIRHKARNLVRLGEKVRKIDQRLHGRNRELQRIDLSRIVQEEVTSIHESHSGTAIRTRIEEVSIHGDTLIRTAVQNLIENAIEHNDTDAPKIDVVAAYNPETDRVELTVSDNGPGIPEAEQRVITAGVETPLEHISGLGLWLVKWIVEGLNGELSIENNEPRGSVVRLSFPPLVGPDGTETVDDQLAERGSHGSPANQSYFNGTVRAEQDGSPIQTTTRSNE